MTISGIRKHTQLLWGSFLFLGLWACSNSTSTPLDDLSSSSGDASSSSSAIDTTDTTDISSSSTDTTLSSSSGGTSSSSEFIPLPDVDSTAPAGPADLKVSSIAGPNTLVITWTDISAFDKNEYLGYQVFRNDNYNGWTFVGTSPPEKQFFKDTTLDPSGEYKYLYRIVAFDTTDAGVDTLISKWSNEAGVLPITNLGFGGTIFDSPSDIAITRWAPSVWEIRWAHSGLKPELGFVVQKLVGESGVQVIPRDTGDTFLNPGKISTVPLLTTEGVWTSLDTLSEANNHFWVKANGSEGLYRVYAYYSDEFGRIWSEFTSEVVTAATYDPSITFLPPVLVPTVIDSETVEITWKAQHKGLDGNNYTDSIWWQFVETRGANVAPEANWDVNKRSHIATGLGSNICSYSLMIRLFWRDKYGVVDYTEYSDPVGTKGGFNSALIDKLKICKE